MNLDSVSVHKHAKYKLGQYPAILTSHLINTLWQCVVVDFTLFLGLICVSDLSFNFRITFHPFGCHL